MSLAVRGLVAGYGRTEVLHDVSLEVADGEIACLLGRNGAGKTTLARSVLGLSRPSAGTVELGGRAVTGRRPHEIARLGVGYAPQEAGVFRELTVWDNLLLACRARSLDAGRIHEVAELLPILTERFGQRAGSLSGGEQKMLMLARAILGPPPVIVLDEISEGVQPSVLQLFAQIIRRTAESRPDVTFLVIEQHMAFALSIASRFAVMENGSICDAGSVGPDTRERITHHLVL